MRPGPTNGHGEFHFLRRPLIRTAPNDGPCRDDVIQWREHVTVAAEKDGEVFRVAVWRGEEPKRELRFREDNAVSCRLIAAGEQCETILDSRATIRLVLPRGRDAERLTEILLRQSRDPPAARAGSSSELAIE